MYTTTLSVLQTKLQPSFSNTAIYCGECETCTADNDVYNRRYAASLFELCRERFWTDVHGIALSESCAKRFFILGGRMYRTVVHGVALSESCVSEAPAGEETA